MTHLMPNLWLIMLMISMLMNLTMVSINYFDYKLFMNNNLLFKMNPW